MFKNKKSIFIIVLILVLPAIFFFLKPGIYWNMHDDMQIIRQLEMEKCLKDGQIPCRWVPDLGYQYGYPLFNYYPPLPYLVGEFWRLFGFSFVDTIKLTAALQIVLTAVFMYLLAKSLTGKTGALLSAMLYTYAPYHAVNIYVRGAMNEAWAATFFPLVLYFLRLCILKNRLPYYIALAISFSAILLSHNPMALVFIPIIIFWAIYWLIVSGKFKIISQYLSLAASALLSFALSAFVTLPVLFESKLVQVESMFSGYYNYSVHFANIKQLFLSNFWGSGPSVWGSYDGMSFMLGFFQWAIPLFILIYFVLRFKKIKNNILPILLVLVGFAYAFMAHERSTPLWMLFKPIQNVQFPWRFLNPAVFILSLSSAYFIQAIKRPSISYILIAFIILNNFIYFYPIQSGPITDYQKFTGESWRLLTTASIYDYLPKTASTAAKSKAANIIDQVEPTDTEYQVLSYQKGTDWWLFNLKNETTAKFTISSLYFPNFRLFDNGQEIKYQVEPLLGRITLRLEPGFHQIYLKLYNTSIRSFSNYLSLAAWLFALVYFVQKLWKSKKSKK